jgi:hypothetical protein
MSTCNRLDLQTLGSQPIMPKNIPDHCPTLPTLQTFMAVGSAREVSMWVPHTFENVSLETEFGGHQAKVKDFPP